MANVNSYYLYQKYEKRGDQPWIPLDVYSVDGDGTMPLVLKEHSSDSCPVIPDGTDDYAYTEWRSADGYMCDDGTKYARERRYVSNDNVNWTATDIYRITDTVIQYNSTDCGYSEAVEEYNCEKWEVVANDYICNEGNKCQKLRKYVRACNDCDNCNSSWVATDIYQIGETVIEYNSNDCGYTASTEEYRWVNVGYVCVGNDKCYRQQKQVSYTYGDTWENLSEYRTGDVYQKDSADCTITPVIYRWVNLNPSQDYYCDGTTKYYKQQYQKSYDNGLTWVSEVPPQYRKGSIAEEFSVDCGFTGQTVYRWVQTSDTMCLSIPDGKFELALNDSSVVTAACDSYSSITSDDTSAYLTRIVSVNIGECVTTIGKNAFSFLQYPDDTSIITSVTIPDSVTVIGENAFVDCSRLTNLKLPNSLQYVGMNSFAHCLSAFTHLVIPDSVISIGNTAFLINASTYRTDTLTAITIGSGVTYIGSTAFGGRNVQSVTIHAVNPPSIGSYAFLNTNNCPIYVPPESVEAYKSAWSGDPPFRDYADRIFPIT